MAVSSGSMPTHLSWMWVCLLVGGAVGVSMDFYALPKADMIQFDSATETVIVGGRRRLMELSMDLSEMKQSAVVGSVGEFDKLDQCRKELRVLGREYQIPFYCHYDVTLVVLPKVGVTNSTIVAAPTPGESFQASETLLYCSTTDNVAVCAHVQRTNFSNIIRFVPGLKYSSLHTDVPTVAGIGSDGNFWGISSTGTRNEVDFVRADYSLTDGDSVWLTQETERMYWFRDSGYASIIEDEEYVYVFFWETPLESSDDSPGPVARVARVCKTDPGIHDERLTVNVFSSFIKVQLICSSAPPPSDTTTTKVYPFIADVFRIINGTLDQKTFTDMVYAVFQASSPLDSDGPTGSALCVFDFAKIRTALDSTVLTNLRTKQQVIVPSPIDCATAVQQRRSAQAVTEETLSTKVVSNEQSQLLHLIADGERFLRVVVDQATNIRNQTFDVIFVLSTHKFLEKLYLYKVTYGTERLRNKRKISYKIEVMVEEARLKQDEDVYGKYLPHEGNRMKLHRRGGDTWLYITSAAGVFRLRTDDCSHYTSCGECVAAQDPHCAFDKKQHKCVSVKYSTGNSELLQDTDSGDTAAMCTTADVTASPAPRPAPSATSSAPPSRSPTSTVASSSPLPSSSSSTFHCPPASSPIGNVPIGNVPNVDNLSKEESAPGMDSLWWAILLTLVAGLVVGAIVGVFVGLLYQWQRVKRMESNKRIPMGKIASNGEIIVPPLTATNDKRRNSRSGSLSVGAKPNNAVEDPVVEVKGRDNSKQTSPEHGESITSTDITAMHTCQSDHSLVNKCNGPRTSDSAVCVQHNPNLADSPSNSPESPVGNWERNRFQGNIDPGDRENKLRHTSTSSAGGWEMQIPLSQSSYTASYNGAIGHPNVQRHSSAGYSRSTATRPLSLSRLSYTSSGVADSYVPSGSPMSPNSRTLPQRQSTPDRPSNGHVTIPLPDSYDC